MAMMLFYSNHCTSSKLLMDNIKRYDAMRYFKLINVEQYMANGYNMPPQIHSVPSIMFIDTKTVLYGKQVFDYLLLPKKGFLLNLVSPASGSGGASGSTSKPPVTSVGGSEPISFNLNSGGGSESFSFIDDTSVDVERSYGWCGVDEQITIHTPEENSSGESSKKKMLDIAALKSQRELDIQQCNAAAVPL